MWKRRWPWSGFGSGFGDVYDFGDDYSDDYVYYSDGDFDGYDDGDSGISEGKGEVVA